MRTLAPGVCFGRRPRDTDLREWIRAAEAARPTCLNLADFDALIRTQSCALET
jgi:hypothetical protein